MEKVQGHEEQHGPTQPKPKARKPALVDKWFSGKRRVFYLTATSQCKLNFNARLIYSFLVSKRSMEKTDGASEEDIARATRLDRFRTVRTSLRTLGDAAFLDESGEEYVAREPDADTQGWFAVRNADAKDWWDRLAYYPIYLQAASSQLSPRTNAVLFLLYSLAGGGNIAEGQSYTGLGKMLPAHSRTVRTSVGSLEEHGLVKLFPCESNRGWFSVALMKPDARHLRWYQDVDGRRSRVYVGLDEFKRQRTDSELPLSRNDEGEHLAASEEATPQVEAAGTTGGEKPRQTPVSPLKTESSEETAPMTEDEFRGKLMRNCDYEDHDISDILQLFSKGIGHSMGPNQFMAFLEYAESEHQINHAKGRYTAVRNSSRLLKYEIMRWIARKQGEYDRMMQS